jgi:hypothetical protein
MPTSLLKLVVLGDSRATNFGCAEDVDAFPAVLASLLRDDYHVRSFARPALRLDRYLKELDDLLAWKPDVIISAFGGRESMYRMAGWLRHLPCDPKASLKGKGSRLPLAWLRRLVWRTILSLFVHSPGGYERLMRSIGAHTYRTAEQYRTALGNLLSVTAEMQAKTLFMGFFPSSMGKFPWCPSARRENDAVTREMVGMTAQGVRMWDPKEAVDFSGLFLSDGIHLNADGHRAIARALADEISKMNPNVAASSVI